MSNIFHRPKPQQATPADVKKALQEITEWNWETGYSFAHVVIDDYNLADGFILYCLHPHVISEWVNEKLSDYYGKEWTLEKSEAWRRGYYRDVVQMTAEIVDLLNWLLDVPEDQREIVEGIE